MRDIVVQVIGEEYLGTVQEQVVDEAAGVVGDEDVGGVQQHLDPDAAVFQRHDVGVPVADVTFRPWMEFDQEDHPGFLAQGMEGGQVDQRVQVHRQAFLADFPERGHVDDDLLPGETVPKGVPVGGVEEVVPGLTPVEDVVGTGTEGADVSVGDRRRGGEKEMPPDPMLQVDEEFPEGGGSFQDVVSELFGADAVP